MYIKLSPRRDLLESSFQFAYVQLASNLSLDQHIVLHLLPVCYFILRLLRQPYRKVEIRLGESYWSVFSSPFPAGCWPAGNCSIFMTLSWPSSLSLNKNAQIVAWIGVRSLQQIIWNGCRHPDQMYFVYLCICLISS